MPESVRPNDVLRSLANDPVAQGRFGEGLQLAHAACRLARALDLDAWADPSPAEVRATLAAELSRQGLTPAQVRRASAEIERYLSYALLRRLESRIRPQAARLLRVAAERLERIATLDSARGEWFLDLQRDLGTDLGGAEARLQAYGLDRESAVALAIALRHRSSGQVDLRLSVTGLPQAAGAPLTLERFRQALLHRATLLKALAADLPRDASVALFDRFPALRRGMLQGMAPGSFLAQVLERSPALYRLDADERGALAFRRARSVSGEAGEALAHAGFELATRGSRWQTLAHRAGPFFLPLALANALQEGEASFLGQEASYVSGGMDTACFLERHRNKNQEEGKTIVRQMLFSALLATL